MKRLLIVICIGLLAVAATAAGEPATDEWIASLAGGWTGDDNETPMGTMGFAMLFEEQEDGSYRSFSAMNRETWIDLRFFEEEEDRWLLTQLAGPELAGRCIASAQAWQSGIETLA